ncbi:MAG TPA: DUF4349 domain-containing protein [Frankiaceae bacterium]|nr:DUF4349 domain-containing protein [Frankiaceae bacterium]
MRRIAFAAALLVVPLAACGSSSDESAGSSGSALKRALPAAEKPAAGKPAGKDGSAGLTHAATLGRSTIRTSAMTVRVETVATAARDAVRIAESKGGYLESEQTANGTAVLTLRVPPEDFTATSDALARLGTVTERTVSTEDVTGDVTDVQGRLKAAKASVERVRALLARASSMSEVTSLESELTEREGALESLETRRRSLAGKTSYASLTVTLTRPVVAAAAAEKPRVDNPGFTGGLRAGWDVFTAAVAILLVVLGAVLPFAAAAAVVGVPLYLLRRRRVSARA